MDSDRAAPYPRGMEFNPALDLDSLSAELARAGRLQVREIFPEPDANAIHEQLAGNVPWSIVHNEGDKVRKWPVEELGRMNPQVVDDMFAQVVEQARSGYQFLYASFSLNDAYFADVGPKPPILKFYEFLTSPPALDWFRRLTGQDDIRWADSQATLYQSGHFLRSHTDRDDAGARVAAYVLNFTPVWERDWGGYLEFYNADHDIELALRPIFNAMNIFLVPVDHAVGIVAPFANAGRLSITGWLRRDDPPGEFGKYRL